MVNHNNTPERSPSCASRLHQSRWTQIEEVSTPARSIEPTWPGRRSVIAVMGASALIQAVTVLLRPASTYQALAMDLPAMWIGAVAAVFALAPLFLAIPAGIVADGIGARSMLIAGGVGMTVGAAILMSVGATMPGLLAGNAVLGVGHLLSTIGGQTFIAQLPVEAGLDKMFGWFTFMGSVGQAAGPLAIATGGQSVQPDTAPMFVIGLVLSAALLVLAFLVRGRRVVLAETPTATRTTTIELLKMPGLLRAVSISAIIVAAIDLTVIYIPLLAVERGLGAGVVSALLTVCAVSSMVSRLGYGRLIGWIGRKWMMTASIMLSAVSLTALAIPLPLAATIAVTAVLGLALGAGQPLTLTWVAIVTPPTSYGQALALRLVGNRVGQIAVPSVLGVLAHAGGVGAVFGSIAVVVALSQFLVRDIPETA